MRKSLITTAVLGALIAPSFVFAADAAPAPDLTVAYNVGLYSQYIFRGMTQTNSQPAIQGGVDLTHSSGFYLGAWGSNISWLKDDPTPVYTKGGSLELDLYGGYRHTFASIGSGLGIDVGALQYWYPGTLNKLVKPGANTTEVYGALNYGWLQGKLSVVAGDDAWGFGKINGVGKNERGTYYAELNANIPIGDTGLTGLLHVGRQEFDSGKSFGTVSASYTDYKVGLSKSFENGVNVGGYWTDTTVSTGSTNALNNWTYAGKNIGQSTGTVFIQKTF